MSGSIAPERPALSLSQRLRIRWSARHIADPDAWSEFVEFHELMAANDWDLAGSFDELNDRYDG